MNRARAETLDLTDPLGPFREEFFVDESGPIYMDGNSLGRLSRRVADAVSSGIGDWRDKLVGGWQEWVDLPLTVGDLIGRLIGAAPGQVLVGDSTTVNLYKLASAALSLQSGRSVIVCDENEFPTDRYVLSGLEGAEVRRIPSDPIDGVDVEMLSSVLDERTALVCLSHVNYRSAARLDVAGITSVVHNSGALMLWDLCHSAGAVPVDLDSSGADLAVGCTYKYLNAGPGSPAFLYVRRELQAHLRSPIRGWFAQRDQFEMGQVFEPVDGVGRFAAGSPPVLGLVAVAAATSLLLDAGLDRLWAKSQALTRLMVELVDDRLVNLGFRLGSPANPERRGAHVSLIHPDAWPICSTLISRGLVVPDFRVPDTVRLGPAPAYTRFVDVYDTVDRIADLLAGGLDRAGESRPRVT